MARALDEGRPVQPDSGSLSSPDLAAFIGWSRANYDAECAAWNEAGDIGLVFVGKDFDLPGKISSLGSAVPSGSNDARKLIGLYERFGSEFINHINGVFAGCLLDRRLGTVILFNDRFGLNRVYYHASANGFGFSSSAAALLAIARGSHRIDQRGLAEFYSVGCVLQNRTLFTGISVLPPASAWSFKRDGSLEKRRYFEPSTWEHQEPLAPSEYTAELTETFGRIIPKYLQGAPPAAMSLTGGLDSRMVLAWAKAAPQSLPCYTFGGPYRDCADVKIARRLASICHQPHTTLHIGCDFFEQFGSLAETTIAATDGTMDVSGAVELYANRLAREISPIRLTGNYGSEILRQHVAFRPRNLDVSLYTPEFRTLLREAADTYRQEAAGHRLTFIAFKQVPWHHYGRLAAESIFVSPRSPFLDNEVVRLAYRVPQLLSRSPQPALEITSRGNSLFDAVSTDRALRKAPIPIVTPLQHRWREFMAKAEYAYDYGMPQWLATFDRSVKPLHLEKLFLGHQKFYHFRVWYRDQLSTTVRDGHFAATERPNCYMDGSAERLIHEHTTGRANRTTELHQLLTVQLIQRIFGSSSCRS